MKKQFLIISIVLCESIIIKAQNILNDPSIVAQHKRQVFERWGDFRPYPKYFLGVQTNFAYATVWGWLSPSINQDYKNGADIRPLKPTGLEVQRLAQNKIQLTQTEKIQSEMDTIYKRNLQDFAHWTSLTVDADPLWLLYYKRMLKPLRDFPDNPQNFLEWGLKNDETYQHLLSIGTIERMQRDLELIKDKFYISRSVDMPRGKRFLMYHETLIGWRNLINEIKYYDNHTTLLIEYKKILEKFRSNKNIVANPIDDRDIVQSVMNQYKNQF